MKQLLGIGPFRVATSTGAPDPSRVGRIRRSRGPQPTGTTTSRPVASAARDPIDLAGILTATFLLQP
jgi:hypothetical protein